MRPLRSAIRVSWQRSQASEVEVDHPAPSFSERFDTESLLLRAARPVLASLSSELSNEPVCLILTDARGLVLQRDGGDPAILSALDRVHLAPGFIYGESEVGTNGIGTALEVGASILIDGNEHYAGALRQFTCAGAPITHPVTGALLGVIDITTAAGNSNSLLVSFAKLAARRIQERILEEANALDGALLGSYYSACQHSGGPVIAVGEKVFMMNALTQQHFDASDQASLLDQARDAVGTDSPRTFMADLPSGIVARLAYQPTLAGGALAGGIIQIKKQHAPSKSGRHRPALAGLAGSSASWRKVSQEVLDAATRPAWIVLQGEPGSGKLALTTAAHKASARPRRLVVVDAQSDDDPIETAAAELETGADLVLRHAGALTTEQLDSLTELLQEIEATWAGRTPWIALTTQTQHDGDELGVHLLHFFPRTVAVPPLRHHPEDLPALVRMLLNRAGASELMLSRAAMQQLTRLSWPNNVTHLREVLSAVLRTRRSGIVEIEDLPPECLATTRRSLTRMESLERDAIVDALSVHGGAKPAAAESLGMSRATIYRKIRDYGIVT